MNVLGLGAFGTGLTVSLSTPEGYYENNRQIGLKHNQILLFQVDEVLNGAGLTMSEIDITVCSQGPGSFTAIRIIMAAAKGLAAGSGSGFVTVPTFECVGALFSWFPGTAAPVIDGKKGKIYTAFFHRGERLTEDMDIPANEFIELSRNKPAPLLLAGEYAAEAADFFQTEKISPLRVTEGFSLGKVLIEEGITRYKNNIGTESTVSPRYIRKSDAELSLKK